MGSSQCTTVVKDAIGKGAEVITAYTNPVSPYAQRPVV